MATHGHVTATLHFLDRLAVPLSVTLPEGVITLSFEVRQKGFLLPRLIGFLLHAPDFQFPAYVDALNHAPLLYFSLSLLPQQRAFGAAGMLEDIPYLLGSMLRRPVLTARIQAAAPSICIAGSVVGGPEDGQSVQLCYERGWRPPGLDQPTATLPAFMSEEACQLPPQADLCTTLEEAVS